MGELRMGAGSNAKRKLRLGMVGGGLGAFIGAVHRWLRASTTAMNCSRGLFLRRRAARGRAAVSSALRGTEPYDLSGDGG